MNIDEAINRVKDMLCNLENGYVDHLAYGGKGDAETEANIYALYEVITALDWYREQDLIERTDAIYCSEDLYKIYEKTINSIPKAEPPKE